MSYWMDFNDKSRLLLNMVLYRSNIHRHFGCLCKTWCRNSIYAWKKISFYLLGQSLMKHILRYTVFIDFIVRFVSQNCLDFEYNRKITSQSVVAERQLWCQKPAKGLLSSASLSCRSGILVPKWNGRQQHGCFSPLLSSSPPFFFSSLLFELENKTWGSRGCWRTALPLGHRKKGWGKWTTLGQFCWGINGSHFPHTDVAVLVS